MMFKKTLIASAITAVAVLSSGAVMADSGEGFVDGSSMNMGIMYYGRERDHDTMGEGIRVHALGLNANFKSGFFNGWLGMDFSAVSNIDLLNGSGHGQSEVLYYDKSIGEERNSSRFNKARLKMKFGNEAMGAKVNAGYTDIYAGTIGTSAGVNAHAYRGLDAKFNMGALQLAYGWADQFQSDWDDEFRDITNKWHARQDYDDPNDQGMEIDYIHSLGLRYTLDDKGWVDVAYGEGKDFRTNYHLAGSYSFDLNEMGKLTLISYYQSGKFEEGASQAFYKQGGTEREHTWSTGLRLNKDNWMFKAGYGQTKAPDFGEYTFRLSAWANSDSRTFLSTTSQLDDFVHDGQKVIMFGSAYSFDGNLQGLKAGFNYNYGWDNFEKNDNDTRLNGTRDGKMHGLDFQLTYTVQAGPMKGLWLGVMPAFLRTSDTDVKDDRNDVKVVASYNISVF